MTPSTSPRTRRGQPVRAERVVTLKAPDPAPPRTDIAFPFHIDNRGRTAETDYDSHVRDMIEQVLFTSAGERVMRPDFGCGLLDVVFAPNSPELASAVELSVHAALQRWLGDVTEVQSLAITSEDNVVRVELAYVVRRTGTRRSDVFEGSAAA